MLLDELLRQLRPTRTVYCLVNGAVLLEGEGYATEALRILQQLVTLVTDPKIRVPVKLLLNSTRSRHIVRAGFTDVGELLDVGALAGHGRMPSEAGMTRELGDAVGKLADWWNA
ncbi:hypothetical protein BO78DRAFT_416869 [Aspergillus sclerotiicarbonarius CBS 121057]|uniref:Uncharacterized protein n=1 Tax=Aspergillus sclerotiicarbonarius (strain CBS 121057 / IBT 28362) TaxID=1448318 RepID=A0A319EDZ8_ASPSB|nr:hypothetical protein BO78DRAFT_416869 [Aspergillus sclerotiicarbonarius CBS 121057]